MPTTDFPRGLTGDLVIAEQSAFDTPVVTGFESTPFYTQNLANAEGLPDDNLLGGARNNDRDQRDPAPDLATHGGAIDVPLCLNNVGWWLIGAFGAPTLSQEAATGAWVFSAQPAVNSTITVNGTVFTFVAGAPSGNQVQIGGSLGATITATKNALNASVVGGVAAATYGESGGNTVTVTHDTLGPAGNAYTLAASATSNATPSGATLAGGCYTRVFTSGAVQLPSRTIGIKTRASGSGAPVWFRNVGCIVNQLRFRVAKEAGYRRVGVDLVGRLQEKVAASVFGSPSAGPALDQVAAALGVVTIDSVSSGVIKTLEANYQEGAEETGFVNNTKYASGYALDTPAAMGGTLAARYQNEAFYDWGQDKSAKALSILYQNGPGRLLQLDMPAVQLVPFGIPITGPAGIETSSTFRAKQTSGAPMLTVTLKNVVATYP